MHFCKYENANENSWQKRESTIRYVLRVHILYVQILAMILLTPSKKRPFILYQIRRPLGLAFVIYFWWLGDLLPLYI